ncbi:MAG: LamG-like jellyroll fold domain-containing protein [Verrucomicrobiota bacterium]
MNTQLPRLACLGVGIALLTGSMRVSAAAVWNQAMLFRGAGDYVRVPDAAALDLTNHYTIECWFRPQAFGGTRGLVSKFATTNANGYVLRLQTNHLEFDGLTNSTISLQTGVWYHVAAVNSNNVRRLYLNGQLLPLSGSNWTVQANADPLCLGADYLAGSNRFFAGRMDEVRIWNTARSQAEIQSTMTASLTGAETNLAAYYRFDEPGGILVRDGASQHLNGTMINLPLRAPSYWWPGIALNSAEPLNTECHQPFVDPVTVSAPVVSVVVLDFSQIALRADGSVKAFPGADDAPSSATNIVAIAGGLAGCLGLRPDGTLMGWNYGWRVPGVPAEATNVVAIAAGRYHFLALRSNGTVVGWGSTEQYNYGQATVPANATNIVAIAAADYHSLALKADGTVIGWGENSFGESTSPAGLSNVVAIAAGTDYSVALRSDGTVVAWGANYYGQCDIPAGFNDITAIAAGNYCSVLVHLDGSVTSVGFPANQNFTWTGNALAAGVSWNRFVTLHSDGNVVIWHIGGAWPEYASPAVNQTRLLPVVTGIVDTNAATSLFPLGYSFTNDVGTAATNNRTVFVVDTLAPTISLNGQSPMMAMTGSAFADPGATASDLCAGDMSAGVAIVNTVNTAVPGVYTNTYSVADTFTNRATVTRTVVVGGPVIQALTVSNLAGSTGVLTGAVQPNGDLPFQTWFEWGPVHGLQYAYHTTPQPWSGGTNPVPLSLALTNLVPGHVYHYRITASNAVWCSRSPDRFFYIPKINFHQPVLQVVPLGNAWTETTTVDAYPPQLTAGIGYTAALKADGTVQIITWWEGGYPADATNLVAIADQICLRADGYVVGWGISNVVAIAGSGTALKEDGSVVIRSGAVVANHASAIAEGSQFGLAALTDGTVAAWGNVGDGQTTVPPEATNVVAVAAGWYHSVALRADGTVVAWGANLNNWGQTDIPADATNVIAIAAGAYHTLALRVDGTVVAWGMDQYGQCDFAYVTNAISIGAGYLQSMVLTSDGTLQGNRRIMGDATDWMDKACVRLTPSITGTVNAGVVGRYPLAYAATNAMGGYAFTNRLVAIATSPLVTTAAPTGGGATDAQMNGTVNARALDTLAWFEYGLLSSYGYRTTNQFMGNGAASQPFSTTEGLLPFVTYHYRAVASNELGRTEGADVAYTVPAPVAEAPVVSVLTNIALPQNGSGAVWFVATPADVPLSVACNNPVLLPNGSLTTQGSGTNRSLVITPAAGQSGSAQVTVTASTAGGTVIRRCTVTVTPPPGGVSAWVKLTPPEGASRESFRFQVQGADADTANFTVEFQPALGAAWSTVSDAIIVPQGGGVFQVDAPAPPQGNGYYRVRMNGTGSAPPQLSGARPSQVQALRFQIVDLGSASTNYAVDYRSDLDPTNQWTAVSNVVVTALSNGVFQVDTAGAPGDTGFYRVRGLRSLSAGLNSPQFAAGEGSGVSGPVIVFNGIYTGPLTCVWTDETGASQTNQIAVNGNSAVIPIPAAFAGENGLVDPSDRLTLTVQAGSGFGLGGVSQSAVTILDNDSDWQGTLQATGCTLGFGLTLMETNGVTGGRIQSAGFGFFPTNALVQVVRGDDSFLAVATNIPIAVFTNYSGSGYTNYIDLRLDAANVPGATNVSPARIAGAARLVIRVTGGRHLDSGLDGTFTLLKTPARSVTNVVPLQPAP